MLVLPPHGKPLAPCPWSASAAEIAAAAVETWSGLVPTGDARRRVSFIDADERAKEREAMVREIEALRVMLRDERKRVQREVRSLKQGWEAADSRPRTRSGAIAMRARRAPTTRPMCDECE